MKIRQFNEYLDEKKIVDFLALNLYKKFVFYEVESQTQIFYTINYENPEK